MKIFIFLFILTFGGFTMACPQVIHPESVMMNSDESEAKEHVINLINNKPKWIYVLSEIENGNKEWLEVAEYLRNYSDASATKELIYSMAFALKNSTDNVLAILDGGYSVNEICSSPFIEENIHYELGFLSAIKENVKNSNFDGINKEKCLKNIGHQISIINQYN